MRPCMTTTTRSSLLLVLAATGACSSATKPPPPPAMCTQNATACTLFPSGATEQTIQDAFASAKAGWTFEFAAGTFSFTNEIVIAQKNITVRGAGMDQTILDFSKQVAGPEAFFGQKVDGILLESFDVRDSKGNAIKILGTDGVTFRKVKTEWTGAEPAMHGGYGLYPVQSKHVLIEGCVATGASDSGVYVGQSQFVVMRNNDVHDNVGGIEIENTYDADIHDNDAHDNSAGILVFDMPDLQQIGGHGIRIFANKIHDNNTKNFAAEGNAVGLVPRGTGFLVMANKDVEVFGNQFANNKTGHAAILSYYATQREIKDMSYYPLPSKLNFHDNTFAGGGDAPDLTKMFGLLLITGTSTFGGVVPAVIYDGIVDPMTGTGPMNNLMEICVKAPSFANIHLDQVDMMNPTLEGIASMDATPYDCTRAPLPAVSWPGL